MSSIRSSDGSCGRRRWWCHPAADRPGGAFFKSGLTRWEGFLSLSPTTVFLFEEEFKLHLFGGTYDLPAPAALAFVTAVFEIVLPTLLVVDWRLVSAPSGF